MTYPELQDLAKTRGLDRVHGVSKADLIAFIEKAGPAPAESAEAVTSEQKPSLIDKIAEGAAAVVAAVAHPLGGHHPVQDPQAQAEASAAEQGPATTYREHMAQWESKADKKAARSSAEQSDLAKHPKFAKFKSQGENQP